MRRLHRRFWATALEGFLDDALDPRRAGRVLDHLDACPECLALLGELARMQRSLSGLAGAGARPARTGGRR